MPVIPVALKGTRNVWPPEKSLPKLSGHISISFGNSISPNTPDLKELAQAQIKSMLKSQ